MDFGGATGCVATTALMEGLLNIRAAHCRASLPPSAVPINIIFLMVSFLQIALTNSSMLVLSDYLFLCLDIPYPGKSTLKTLIPLRANGAILHSHRVQS